MNIISLKKRIALLCNVSNGYGKVPFPMVRREVMRVDGYQELK
jgi:hypothetical protein